jgi:hypothetical protein
MQRLSMQSITHKFENKNQSNQQIIDFEIRFSASKKKE